MASLRHPGAGRRAAPVAADDAHGHIGIPLSEAAGKVIAHGGKALQRFGNASHPVAVPLAVIRFLQLPFIGDFRVIEKADIAVAVGQLFPQGRVVAHGEFHVRLPAGDPHFADRHLAQEQLFIAGADAHLLRAGSAQWPAVRQPFSLFVGGRPRGLALYRNGYGRVRRGCSPYGDALIPLQDGPIAKQERRFQHALYPPCAFAMLHFPEAQDAMAALSTFSCVISLPLSSPVMRRLLKTMQRSLIETNSGMSEETMMIEKPLWVNSFMIL